MAKPIEESCAICYKTETNKKVIEYSLSEFDHVVCFDCQQKELKKSVSTIEAKRLYVALKFNRVPAILEKFDLKKTIDIAVPKYKLNIEVDGVHHNVNFKQAMSDLKRTFYSFQKGYYTFRVPNILIRENLHEVSDYITELIRTSKEQIERERELQHHLRHQELNGLLLVKFLSHFQVVFEQDWIYTQDYISELGTQNLLCESLDDSNWNNRDALIRSYREILSILSRNNIVGSLDLENQPDISPDFIRLLRSVVH